MSSKSTIKWVMKSIRGVCIRAIVLGVVISIFSLIIGNDEMLALGWAGAYAYVIVGVSVVLLLGLRRDMSARQD